MLLLGRGAICEVLSLGNQKGTITGENRLSQYWRVKGMNSKDSKARQREH